MLISMARQGMGELHKIKWNKDKVITIPHIFHMLLIKWDANYHVTT
jgi:hypothetical protein